MCVCVLKDARRFPLYLPGTWRGRKSIGAHQMEGKKSSGFKQQEDKRRGTKRERRMVKCWAHRACLSEISMERKVLPIQPRNDSFMIGNPVKWNLSIQYFSPPTRDPLFLWTRHSMNGWRLTYLHNQIQGTEPTPNHKQLASLFIGKERTRLRSTLSLIHSLGTRRWRRRRKKEQGARKLCFSGKIHSSSCLW